MSPDAMPPGGGAPGGPVPPWPAAAHPPPYPLPPCGHGPRRSRKRLVITLVSVVAVLIGAVFVGVFRHHGKASLTAGDTVRAYLEALSRGDAAAALSYSDDEPATKDFLTDDILKRQLAQWPITNIRILNDDSSIGMIHVAVNFGDQVSDQTVNAKKNTKGIWKVEHAAVKLSFAYNSGRVAAMKTLTLFGTPVDTSGTTYVFPGWVDFGSTNPNIAVKQPGRPYLLDALSYGESPMLNFEISEAGQGAIDTALKSALAQCARSTDLHPDQCPQYIYDSSLVNGTAQWTVPSDLSPVKGFLDEDDLTVRLRGPIEFGLTATSSSGGQKSGKIPAAVYGTADLTKNQPVVTFR
jgi:hypothetical protein